VRISIRICVMAWAIILSGQDRPRIASADTAVFDHDGINLPEEKHAFEALMLKLKALDDSGAVLCSEPGDTNPYRCIGGDFLPPFPSGFPSLYSDRNGTNIWAPPNFVSDGQRLLTNWRNLAASAELFDCGLRFCRIIIGGLSSKSGVRSLLLCEVVRLGARQGAPENCTPILIDDGTAVWMRAIAREYGCFLCDYTAMMGMKDFDLMGTGKGLSERQLTTAIQQALSAAPLLLEAVVARPEVIDFAPFVSGTNASKTQGTDAKRTLEESSYLTAISDRRESRILSGHFREWITVRADLRVQHVQNRNDSFTISISTNLLVNRRPTAEEREWHMPSTDQNQQFLRAILNSMKSSLKILCPAGQWSDSRTLNCGIPAHP